VVASVRFLISVDPGDVNNGFCFFKYDATTRKADTRIMQVLSSDSLEDYLKIMWGTVNSAPKEDPPEVHFVVENFRIDGHVRNKVFQWSEVVTVRNIGKVQMVAKWLGAKFTTQEPGNVLPMGRKWAPFKLPKGHIPDDKSAWIHGAHYMMNMKWINTVDQITMMGQEKL
jgi:hypothetical protein